MTEELNVEQKKDYREELKRLRKKEERNEDEQHEDRVKEKVKIMPSVLCVVI